MKRLHDVLHRAYLGLLAVGLFLVVYGRIEIKIHTDNQTALYLFYCTLVALVFLLLPASLYLAERYYKKARALEALTKRFGVDLGERVLAEAQRLALEANQAQVAQYGEELDTLHERAVAAMEEYDDFRELAKEASVGVVVSRNPDHHLEEEPESVSAA